MSRLLDQIMQHTGVTASPAASPADIGKLEDFFGVVLPSPLRELWNRTAKVQLEYWTQLLSPVEIHDLLTNPKFDERFQQAMHRYGFLPILDMNSSDYVVACVREPLAPRYAWLPHDDGPSLLYRDFDSFLSDLLHVLTHKRDDEDEEEEEEVDAFYDADSYFHLSPVGDYQPDDRPRDQADEIAALALLQTDGKHHEWNFAAQLLNADNTAAWERLLETEHFVRRDVTARLKNMSSPIAQRVLAHSNQAMEDFIAMVSGAATHAGFNVSTCKDGMMKIGRSTLMLECFFYRRHIPDAMPRLMDWLKDQQEGRNPNERPNNYMVD